MKKITCFEHSMDLCENSQYMRCKFSWLDKSGQMQTPWMLCRDYFNEIWYKFTTGKDTQTVYGFKSNWVTKKEVGQKRIYIGMMFEELSHKKNFFTNLALINEAESKNGFGLTKAYNTSDPLRIVVTSSMKWMDNPTLFCVLHFMLRLACYPSDITGKLWRFPKHGTDYTLLNENMSLKFVEAIFTHFRFLRKCGSKSVIYQMSSDGVPGYGFHNTSGIGYLYVMTEILGKKNCFTKAAKEAMNALPLTN